MADLTTAQFQAKLWQAVVDTNTDGNPRRLQIINGSNVVTVTVTRDALNMDKLV